MEDLIVEYAEFDRVAEEINECAAAVKSDNTKISQYLSELNTYWKGAASEKFCSNMEDYVKFFQAYQNQVEDDANTIKEVKKAYQKFETHFLNRKI